jgi:hypothetical protein
VTAEGEQVREHRFSFLFAFLFGNADGRFGAVFSLLVVVGDLAIALFESV